MSKLGAEHDESQEPDFDLDRRRATKEYLDKHVPDGRWHKVFERAVEYGWDKGTEWERAKNAGSLSEGSRVTKEEP